MLEAVVEALGQLQKSPAEIIHERFGLKTASVIQTIEAKCLGREEAGVLGATAGDAMLVARRDYFAKSDPEPLLSARPVCRADATKLVSRFSGPD